jgi:hypothetical protein
MKGQRLSERLKSCFHTPQVLNGHGSCIWEDRMNSSTYHWKFSLIWRYPIVVRRLCWNNWRVGLTQNLENGLRSKNFVPLTKMHWCATFVVVNGEKVSGQQ